MKNSNKAAQIYQHALLLHHKNPVGFNHVIKVDAHASGENAACGDEIMLQIHIEHHHIKDIAFQGDSCAICRASASMLCQDLALGSLTMALTKVSQIKASLQGKSNFSEITAPLSAVAQYPIRLQCALLPWTTLEKAITSLNIESEE